MPDATVKQVKDCFEVKKATEFMAEWKELSDEDKAYFKEAVGQELETV